MSETRKPSKTVIKLNGTPEGKVLRQVCMEMIGKYKNGAPSCPACGVLSAELVVRIAREAMRRWAKEVTNARQ